MILISNDFWHKIKMDNFDSCGVFLAIAINIHALLTTAFVLQGHVYALEGLVNDALRNISELLHPLIQWNIKRDLFTQYFPNCPTVQQKTPRVHQLPRVREACRASEAASESRAEAHVPLEPAGAGRWQGCPSDACPTDWPWARA